MCICIYIYIINRCISYIITVVIITWPLRLSCLHLREGRGCFLLSSCCCLSCYGFMPPAFLRCRYLLPTFSFRPHWRLLFSCTWGTCFHSHDLFPHPQVLLVCMLCHVLDIVISDYYYHYYYYYHYHYDY